MTRMLCTRFVQSSVAAACAWRFGSGGGRRRCDQVVAGGAHIQARSTGHAQVSRYHGADPHSQVHLHGAAYAGGGECTCESVWRHPWTVLRHAAAILVRWDASSQQLSFLGGLRGQGSAGHRGHMSVVCAQN